MIQREIRRCEMKGPVDKSLVDGWVAVGLDVLRGTEIVVVWCSAVVVV